MHACMYVCMYIVTSTYRRAVGLPPCLCVGSRTGVSTQLDRDPGVHHPLCPIGIARLGGAEHEAQTDLSCRLPSGSLPGSL